MPHAALQPRSTEAEAAAALAAGAPVIAVARDRGVFLHAASLATPETVNLGIVWGRGLTCFSVTPERAMRLGLLLAGAHDGGPLFLRSVEAAACQGTGISAADRAMTLRAAGAPDAGIASLKSPGHVIPAMASAGKETTPGATLALLRRLTGFEVPAWTDILNDAGELASPAECEALASQLGLICVSL